MNNKTRKIYGGEEPNPVPPPPEVVEPTVVPPPEVVDPTIVPPPEEVDPTIVPSPEEPLGEPEPLENFEEDFNEVEPIVETTETGFGEEPIIPIVESSSNGESTELQEFRNRIEEYKINCFYLNTSISTEQNKDKSYKREGVLHFTDSVTVTGDGHAIMSLGGIIGDKGIEISTYDKLRNIALQKVSLLLSENQRCYNTRLHFERNGDTIFVHIYGTLYAKKE
jgi:hypothetical protein